MSIAHRSGHFFVEREPLKQTIVSSVIAGLVVYYLTRVAVPAAVNSETQPAESGSFLDGILDAFKSKVSDKMDDLLPSEEADNESEQYA